MVQQLQTRRRFLQSPSSTDAAVTQRPRQRLVSALEGSLQVFTSVHRSFFTNVMVQALRSADQGMSVLVAQFLKGGIDQGPEGITHMGQNLDWIRCGYPGCIFEATDEAQAAVGELWLHVRQKIQANRYDLVLLDELSLAIEYGLIPETEVLTLLKQRPASMDMILTGPKMPSPILAMADQVTEFRREFLP